MESQVEEQESLLIDEELKSSLHAVPVVLETQSSRCTIKGVVIFTALLCAAMLFGITLHFGGAYNGSDEYSDHSNELLFNYTPLCYRLVASPNPLDCSVVGNVRIIVTVSAFTMKIVLYADDFIVDMVHLYRITSFVTDACDSIEVGEDISIEGIRADAMTGQLHIRLANVTEPGNFLLNITYYSRQSDAICNDNLETLIFSGGRHSFPSFNEKLFRTPVCVTLVTRAHYSKKLFSSMPVAASLQNTNNRSVAAFECSPPLHVNSVAFGITIPWVNKLAPHTALAVNGTLPVTIWTNGDHNLDHTSFSLSVAVRALDFFSELLQPLPLKKLEIVIGSDINSWGLISMPSSIILHDPRRDSVVAGERIGLELCSRISRQWFGHFTSPRLSTDMWLNEGWATALAYICADSLFPWRGFAIDFTTEIQSPSLAGDSRFSLKIDGSIDDNVHLAGLVGSSLLHMIHALVNTAFFPATIELLESNAFSGYTSKGLWDTLNKHTSSTSKPAVGNWTLTGVLEAWEAETGHVTVTVGLSECSTLGKCVCHLEQHHSTDNDATVLPLPVGLGIHSAASLHNSSAKLLWLTERRLLFDCSPHTAEGLYPFTISNNATASLTIWVEANIQRYGYFRVAYDAAMWPIILAKLIDNRDVVSQQTRAGMLDDTFYLARSGTYSPLLPLRLISAVLVEGSDSEPDLLSWNSAEPAIQYYGVWLHRCSEWHRFVKKLIYRSLSRSDLHYSVGLSRRRTILLSRLVELGVFVNDKLSFKLLMEILHHGGSNLSDVAPTEFRRSIFRAMEVGGNVTSIDIIRFCEALSIDKKDDDVELCRIEWATSTLDVKTLETFLEESLIMESKKDICLALAKTPLVLLSIKILTKYWGDICLDTSELSTIILGSAITQRCNNHRNAINSLLNVVEKTSTCHCADIDVLRDKVTLEFSRCNMWHKWYDKVLAWLREEILRL